MDRIWLVVREDNYEEECRCGNYYKVPEISYLSAWSTVELANAEMMRLRDSGMKRVYTYSCKFGE
jgi:hypothetical protein